MLCFRISGNLVNSVLFLSAVREGFLTVCLFSGGTAKVDGSTSTLIPVDGDFPSSNSLWSKPGFIAKAQKTGVWTLSDCKPPANFVSKLKLIEVPLQKT